MGRIRSIKPEFPHSESIGRISRDARLLFIQLWTLADDYGRCRAAAPLLAGQLYPYDEDAVGLMPVWLAELEDEGMVRLYTVGRSSYLEITAWAKHQRVDNAGKTTIPPPEDHVADEPAASPEPITKSSPRLAETRGDSPLDQDQDQEGSRTAREPARRGKPREPSPPSVPRPDDVPEAVWRDWLALRSGKRARVTATAVDGMRSEAAKAGLTLAQALEVAVTQGWQGFRADWLAKRGKPDGQSHSPQQDRHRSEFDLGDPRCGCLSCRAVRRDRGGAA